MDGEVTPPREIGVADRLLYDGADDGDLEVWNLSGRNGSVIHLQRLIVSIGNFRHYWMS